MECWYEDCDHVLFDCCQVVIISSSRYLFRICIFSDACLGGIDNSSPNHSFFPPTLVWVNQIGGYYVVIHIAVAFLGYLVHKPFGPIFTNKELSLSLIQQMVYCHLGYIIKPNSASYSRFSSSFPIMFSDRFEYRILHGF